MSLKYLSLAKTAKIRFACALIFLFFNQTCISSDINPVCLEVSCELFVDFLVNVADFSADFFDGLSHLWFRHESVPADCSDDEEYD